MVACRGVECKGRPSIDPSGADSPHGRSNFFDQSWSDRRSVETGLECELNRYTSDIMIAYVLNIINICSYMLCR